jgi:glycerate kinase
MRIVVAPDSWKECLPAPAVAAALAAGATRACPAATIVSAPVADGGEGFAATLALATHGALLDATVAGPLGEAVSASFARLGEGTTFAIEMAAAAGLELVPAERRDPSATTTFGVGELVRRALDLGARKLIFGLGGSATNDGGAGLAAALGYRLLDEHGHAIPPTGAGLARLHRIDASAVDPRLAGVSAEAACDVANPLLGVRGAAAVFGPQKGASPQMVAKLDANLARWAERLRLDLGRVVAALPGAGAAGGFGAGLAALLGATLRPGIDLVLDALRFDELLAEADLCLTGEGALDASSLHGKATLGVARRCRAAGVPCVALCGRREPEADALLDHGLTAMFTVAPRTADWPDARVQASTWIADAARHAVALFAADGRMSPDATPHRHADR